MKQVDLLIKNALCVHSTHQEKTDIAIAGGVIVAMGANLEVSATEIFEAEGYHLIPGVIDSQVHFREPGLTHKEDLESGSLAAAHGGVTTFLEMPNTNPSTTTLEAIEDKIKRARGRCWSDFGFFIGATEDNLEELLKTQGREGVAGIKIFLGSSTGSLLLTDEVALQKIFEKTTAIISVHSENERILVDRTPLRDQASSAHAHPVWRNVDSALSSTMRIVELARPFKRKLHLLHISTKNEMEFLALNKDLCTVEVLPQHLTLSSPTCYDQLGTYAQMNPPIRDEEHRLGLWQGVKAGVVDVIGSDHAPHTKEEKNRGYPHSPSGMPGVQTMLGVMLSHVERGQLELSDIVRLLCTNPARLFSLKGKGELKVGNDADINILDFNSTTVIKHDEMKSRVGWTPFDGLTYKGRLVTTLLRGRPILEQARGCPIRHNEIRQDLDKPSQ
jgi:dihydroorotase